MEIEELISYLFLTFILDITLILATVIAIGFLSIWYPVRYLSKRLLKTSKTGIK